MYGHFIQFTIPKIGQALVAVVLYMNFLKLPFVACFAGVYPAAVSYTHLFEDSATGLAAARATGASVFACNQF